MQDNTNEFGEPEIIRRFTPKEIEEMPHQQWKNLQSILSLFRNTPGVQITIYNMDGFPNGVKADCQDEPHLIATDSDEADAILDMWEAGK